MPNARLSQARCFVIAALLSSACLASCSSFGPPGSQAEGIAQGPTRKASDPDGGNAEDGGGASTACVPSCERAECGDDGCAGECGRCQPGFTCNAMRRCECQPSCAERACGDDGCGGVCGTCAGGQQCSAEGRCACKPECEGKVCGDDGCGGACGSCESGLNCSEGGDRCECIPQCDGRSCGGDGCGGRCGQCASNERCDSEGSCRCVRDCDDECGRCNGNRVCVDGRCVKIRNRGNDSQRQ